MCVHRVVRRALLRSLTCIELELERVNSDLSCVMDEQLASTRQLESQSNELTQLHEELERLRVENETLNERVREQGKDPPIIKEEGKRSTSSENDESSSSDNS